MLPEHESDKKPHHKWWQMRDALIKRRWNRKHRKIIPPHYHSVNHKSQTYIWMLELCLHFNTSHRFSEVCKLASQGLSTYMTFTLGFVIEQLAQTLLQGGDDHTRQSSCLLSLLHKESRLKNMTEKYIFSDHITPCLYVTFRSHILHLLLPAV